MCAELHKMAGILTTCGDHSSPYCIWVISSQCIYFESVCFPSTSNSYFKSEQEDAFCYKNSAQAPLHHIAWQNWNSGGTTHASATKSLNIESRETKCSWRISPIYLLQTPKQTCSSISQDDVAEEPIRNYHETVPCSMPMEPNSPHFQIWNPTQQYTQFIPELLSPW